jgi:hypothetical protein
MHSGVNFARFSGLLSLQPFQKAPMAPTEVVLRHLRLSNLPEAASDTAQGGGDTRALLAHGGGGEIRGDTRALLGQATSLIWFVDTVPAARHVDSSSIAIRVENCEAVVECDEIKFLQHFAQRLQAGPNGRSNAHATFQVRSSSCTRWQLPHVECLNWSSEPHLVCRHRAGGEACRQQQRSDISAENCKAGVECDEMKLLQHFAQRLQAGPDGMSSSSAGVSLLFSNRFSVIYQAVLMRNLGFSM